MGKRQERFHEHGASFCFEAWSDLSVNENSVIGNYVIFVSIKAITKHNPDKVYNTPQQLYTSRFLLCFVGVW